MAAYPFGNHPTLAQYIDWAIKQGCTVQSGISVRGGRPCAVTKIVDPSGRRWVVEVGTQQDEYLLPSVVARFDRRLGLKSPFASLDGLS